MAGLDPWTYAERTRNEYAEQVALFMWANMAAYKGVGAASDPEAYRSLYPICDPIPELHRLFAIKNAGHGDAVRGAMSKAEGVKAGVPDIMLPVPKARLNSYKEPLPDLHGLFIELKRLKSARGTAGKTAEVQTEWHAYLREAGYAVEVCLGWEAARDAILRYLGLK